MAAAGAHPFSTMRLPLGTQRSAASRTGQSARSPETWAAYLSEQVLPFWSARGWLDRALVWGWDEPGPAFGRRYVDAARPAPRTRPACRTSRPALRAAHPGAPRDDPVGQGTRSFTIPAHGVDNGFLWDDQGCDDVDIWAVLSRRFYGSFATPVESAARRSTSQRELRPAIRDGARARGASIWSFTYEAGLGSPGYAATEPATNARVFGLWNALEGIDGTLYADGLTSYAGLDPYQRSPSRASTCSSIPPLAPGRRAGLVAAAREPARRHRGRRPRAPGGRAARPRGAARDPRARAHLLDPRRAAAARLHAGLRPPHRDEVRLAALPPRRGHGARRSSACTRRCSRRSRRLPRNDRLSR